MIPNRDFGAGFYIARCADNHHVAYKCRTGVACTAVVDVRCMHPDAKRLIPFLFGSLVTGRATVLITIFDVRVQTRDWTAKDVG